jgi:hypothetical protein
MPRLSVVIAVCNAAARIVPTIRAALLQTGLPTDRRGR